MINLLLDTPLSNDQLEFASTIKTSADALLCIINDILDFSKIEAGKMALERTEFDVNQAVKDAMALLAPRAKEKGLAFTQDIAAGVRQIVTGDPSRLRQILLNLMGNAIKFTEKGQVSVEVKQLGANDKEVHLCFTVRDTGIGLSAEAQGKLFQSFSQADASTTRRFGGTGLGLAICRKLVELMCGSINVSSKLGEGSTFTFILPFGCATAVKNGKPSPAIQFAGGAYETSYLTLPVDTHILLAEDNKVNQLVGVKQLKKLGFTNVDIVSDGAEAVEAWKHLKPEIILMDCQMPGMDGYEAAKKIRELEVEQAWKRTPIIAMTANAMAGDREICLAAGMDDYIAKPVREDDLRSALQRASRQGREEAAPAPALNEVLP